MTYEDSGVSYTEVDPFKIACQRRAALTDRNALRFGIGPMDWTRGESAAIIHFPTAGYVSHVEEGLGTKNLVADAVRKLTGKTYYSQVAQCTIAMIVNDMATLGVSPVSVAMHLAVGDSSWFADDKRVQDLIAGWGDACDLARCIYIGGETPVLKGIVMPDTALLSGSAVGVPSRNLLRPDLIQPGDDIIMFTSSGIHANGLTLAREIATKLPDGYATLLSDGKMYGEALLNPTHIYCGFVEDCLCAGIGLHYGVNITGHGWRKLMRADRKLAYVVDALPPPLPIFDFIQKHGPVDDREAYGNLNMGAGMAFYVSPHSRRRILDLCNVDNAYGFRAIVAGHVEDSSTKKVVIKPKDLVYEADTLAVR